MENVLFMTRTPERNAAPVATVEVATLVQRTIAGDSDSFEQLVRRYEHRILTLCIRLLGCAEDAQDAAQDVFLRAYKYLHRLDLTRPIEPWLVRMAVNVCRDFGRNRQRRRITFPELPNPELTRADDSSNPHRELTELQRKQFLWKALADLPEKERTAVILRDLEGMSTAEVASVLGSTETTVRSQVCRARLKMRQAIEGMAGGRL